MYVSFHFQVRVRCDIYTSMCVYIYIDLYRNIDTWRHMCMYVYVEPCLFVGLQFQVHVRCKKGLDPVIRQLQLCCLLRWLAPVCVWHDSWFCGTWLIDVSPAFSSAACCGDWHLFVCDMTHDSVGHDSLTWALPSALLPAAVNGTCVGFGFVYGMWLIHMWDMTHSYVRYDWCICVTWLLHVSPAFNVESCCAEWHIYLYVDHDSSTRGTWTIHMCVWFQCCCSK